MNTSTSITTDWIGRWARYAPDRTVLEDVDEARSVTYGQASRMVYRASAFLRERLARGSRVAVLAPNSIEYVLLYFAAQQAGMVLVPLNWRLAAPELDYIIGDSDPALVLTSEDFQSTLDALTVSIDPMPMRELAEIMHDESRPAEPSPNEPDFDAATMILYTAGTTGRPKGAILSHRGIFFNAVNTALRLSLTETDRTPIFAPLFHTGGWHVLTTPLIHAGGTIFLSQKFDADLVLELCDEREVSVLFGVPTMLAMMHDSPRFASSSLQSVRYAIVGGEPMPLPLIHAWHEKGVPIRQGFGLTEFGPNVYSLPEADAERKIGSIGFPNFYIDAAIQDDEGNILGEDETGELILRGPVAMLGYWNNPEATAETIVDGWLHTGDLVRRDPEGYYYVVGRKKDMFISGAENVYPVEIELAIQRIPEVSAVAVIGVPDERWGEVGHAFIVCKTGATLEPEAVIEHCRANLARYKVPKHVSFVDALPVSDSGKILKRVLRDQHAAEAANR